MSKHSPWYCIKINQAFKIQIREYNIIKMCNKVGALKCFKDEIQSMNTLSLRCLKTNISGFKSQCWQWILMCIEGKKNIRLTFSLPARSTRYSFPLNFCSVSTFSCLMFIRKMLWLRELCSFMSKEQSEERRDSYSGSLNKTSLNSLFLTGGVVKLLCSLCISSRISHLCTLLLLYLNREKMCERQSIARSTAWLTGNSNMTVRPPFIYHIHNFLGACDKSLCAALSERTTRANIKHQQTYCVCKWMLPYARTFCTHTVCISAQIDTYIQTHTKQTKTCYFLNFKSVSSNIKGKVSFWDFS